MHSIHKTFYNFRTVFFCFLLVFPGVLYAQAENSLFTVENVNVDVTAQSAVAARELAFEKAQLDAFIILTKRMLSDGEASTFQTPEISTVSSLIQDYEISNEQLSSVRYKATYKFRFKDKDIKQFFSGANLDYTDISARPALVLPFLQRGDQTMLWSPYNAFMKAWNRADDLMSGLVPLVVPLGDISDVQDIGDEDAMNYQASKMERILARYEASEAIILVATPDETLSRVENPSDAAVGALNIYMYRTDRGRPEFVQGIDVSASSNDTLASLMDRAVQNVRSELRKDWKSRTVVNSSQNNAVKVRVQFASLKEWADTQKALKRVYGINNVKVISVTPSEAHLDLAFQGDESRLVLALEQANFSLQASKPSLPTKDPMSYYSNIRNNDPVVYDLSLKRYR